MADRMNPLRLLLLLALETALALRPLLGGPACRFHPSCSGFAREALRDLAPWRALRAILCRLARCHPFHPGGVDPVPAS